MSGIVDFTCKSCGGTIEFSPKLQKLICKSCGTEYEAENADDVVQEYNFNKKELSKADFDWQQTVNVFKCKGCGAEITLAEKVTSTSCPYCSSEYVIESTQNAGIRPEGIILFRITKEEIGERFNKWLKWKVFAPGELRRLYESDKIFGMYLPYWTYDAETSSDYQGQGGRTVTETYTVNGKTEQRTRTDWYPVSGHVDRFFDDVLVNAGSSHRNLMEYLAVYNTKECVPFASNYLVGFTTEKYSLGPKECFEKAKEEMRREIEDDAESQILQRYDKAMVSSINTTYSDVKFKHILVPVWVSGYYYKGKQYLFIVNGQGGQIKGSYPISYIKVAITVIIGLIVVIALAYYFGVNY